MNIKYATISKARPVGRVRAQRVGVRIHAGDTVTIAHVGDSRCYLQRRDEGLHYQTKDHVRLDFGWGVVDRCFFSYRPEVAVPDTVQFRLKTGDRILLCSDSLYKSVTPEILKERMMDDKQLADVFDVYGFLCDKNGMTTIQ